MITIAESLSELSFANMKENDGFMLRNFNIYDAITAMREFCNQAESMGLAPVLNSQSANVLTLMALSPERKKLWDQPHRKGRAAKPDSDSANLLNLDIGEQLTIHQNGRRETSIRVMISQLGNHHSRKFSVNKTSTNGDLIVTRKA